MLQGNAPSAAVEMTSTILIERARQAMTLREVVLPLLAGVPLTSSEQDALRATAPTGWQLLATAECCAIPLVARLRATNMLCSLPGDVQQLLSAAELREMQRVMAARGALRVLDTIAESLGIELTVLKGGAVAAQSDRIPLDLGDVDVLTVRDDAATIARALLDAGWREKNAPGLSAIEHEEPMSNHFLPLLPPGAGIPVELHQRMHYDGTSSASRSFCTRPLRGFRALHRLVGAEAVVSLLEHSVIEHPHRRGHLRDLVLLADAMAECSAEERWMLSSLLDGARFEVEMREMLALSEAFAAGERALDGESVRRAVARKYLLALGDDGRLAARIPGWWKISSIGLERPILRRALYGDLLRTAFTRIPPGSTFEAKGLARRTPGVARAAGWIARATYRTALTVFVIASGRFVRRGIQAVLRTESAASR